MSRLVETPEPPYYCVVFSSIRTSHSDDEYEAMAKQMVELASKQPGFLGIESARQEIGITVSYWDNLENIAAWKAHAEHQIAQESGRSSWYQAYKVKICRVERQYGSG